MFVMAFFDHVGKGLDKKAVNFKIYNVNMKNIFFQKSYTI